MGPSIWDETTVVEDVSFSCLLRYGESRRQDRVTPAPVYPRPPTVPAAAIAVVFHYDSPAIQMTHLRDVLAFTKLLL